MLPRFQGRNVLLMGHVSSLHGRTVFRTCDDVEVNVVLPPGDRFEGYALSYYEFSYMTITRYSFSQYYEVLGKVFDATRIDAYKIHSAGNNFNMKNYNQAIELMHSPAFSTLFM